MEISLASEKIYELGRKYLDDNGLDSALITEEKAEKLAVYMAGILEKNKDVNLTSITDEGKFIEEHIIDSFAALKFGPYVEAEKVIDVGTGAGIPGAVLAVMSPEKKFVLLDSLAKRLKVIEELSEEAGIGNIELVHERAEDAGRRDDLRGSFDVAVSRAVAGLPVLLELCLPLVRKGGYLLAYKGAKAEEEIENSSRALSILGGGTPHLLHAGVSGHEHVLIAIKKQQNTPSLYPRKAGTPSRKPL